MSIGARLRRLEDRTHGGRCPECGLSPDGPGRIVYIDEKDPERSFRGDTGERCGRCGRRLYFVIEVVYGPPAGVEGEGGVSYGAL